jgi:hypothetical protein
VFPDGSVYDGLWENDTPADFFDFTKKFPKWNEYVISVPKFQ